jgi:hypothetical protein
MIFELEEFHRNISDDDLIADLVRVSQELNKKQITFRDSVREISQQHRRGEVWLLARSPREGRSRQDHRQKHSDGRPLSQYR